MTLSSSLSPLFPPTSFAEENCLMSISTSTSTTIKTCQASSPGAGDISSSFTMNPISPPLSPTSAPRNRPFEQLVIQTPHYGQKHPVCRLDTTTDLENQLSPDLLDVYCCFNCCSPASGLSPLATTIPSSSLLDLCGDTSPSPSTTVLLNQLLEDVSTATSAFPLLPDEASGASLKASILASSSTTTTSVAAPSAVSSKKKPLPLKTPAPPALSCAAGASATRAPDFVFDPQRTWSTFFVDRSFLTSTDDDVEIRAKTRRDTPCLSVPDRLYSSLKYEIKQRAVGPFAAKVPFLLSRICVVDAETGCEVRRNNRPAVKGTIEAALVKPTDKKKKKQQLPVSPSTIPPVLEGGLRAQFQDISFHSDHTLYCWHISYFAPSDLDHAVLVKRSPSFKVFARKPGKLSSRKRKRSTDTAQASSSNNNNNNSDDDCGGDEDGDDVDAGDGGDLPEQAGDAPTDSTNISKKAKCCSGPQEEPASASCSSASANVVFDEFMCKLDELVKCKDRLTEQERHVCLDLVVSKLLAADPSYFAALANSPQPSAADSFAPQQPDSSFILSPDCSSSSSFRRSPSTNLSF